MSSMRSGVAVGAVCALFVALGSAQAQEPLGGVVSGIRLGVLAHDFGPLTSHDEDAVDFNAEVLFASPDFLEPILAPRPHIGAIVNADSDATDQIYAGLTWTFDLTDQIFFDIGGGGAIHNGKLTAGPSDRTLLGCRVLFRGAAGLGYQIDDHHNVALHFDHISNAFLCDPNEGLETVGIRYGYQF